MNRSHGLENLAVDVVQFDFDIIPSSWNEWSQHVSLTTVKGHVTLCECVIQNKTMIEIISVVREPRETATAIHYYTTYTIHCYSRLEDNFILPY